MLNSGRFITAVALCLALAGATASLRAQSAASVRYEVLREQELRVSMSAGADAGDFRIVINRYWSFVRQYPKTGYADNALWQAAALSMDAFVRFGEDRDRYRAIQLFQWLRDQYPHSGFAARAAAQITQLAQTEPQPRTLPESRPPSQPAFAASTIRALQRQTLPEVVRVTIELDREVPFYQERLEGPSRLFFDLKSTRTIPALADATFRYDSDVVRHIRLGRHPNNTTRIVLDLENVSRYSVFTLYNPYRIVIDSERSVPLQLAVNKGATSGTRSISVTPSAPVAFVTSRAPVVPNPTSALPAPRKPATAAASSVPVVPSPRVAPPAPSASTSTAPVAPPVPNAPVTPSTPVAEPDKPVLTGKPLSPSANWSGKFSVARQLGLGVSRIVIDAGHGGHDPGASAFNISEAELVLDVTLRLEKLLLQQPGMEVVLTRRTNEYLSLEERTEVANRDSADLFLSIHANASANGTTRGVETYFLNFALNPQAEAVAARENAASGRTMNSLPGIVKAITLNSKLNESRDFAATIQRALVRGLRPGNKDIKDLGVKQAPFMVLIGAAMPSVLAEISFVTNPQEARLLKTPAYRQRIAESLLAGVLRY
ncbi:MAG TPA: N-acetylmuramoyl-L-alanine amidase, partial [Vicinamibacterales bacterium]|nr:N-acetylmuramoyl-L-alanine amidase [Vicinamibacterales bacterium]